MNLTTDLPTGRRGQVLAVTILVVALGLVWLVIAAPLIEWHGERAEQLANRTREVEHMERLVAQLGELETRASQSAGRDADTERMLPGASDAVAAAALQSLVQERASSAGLTLTSIEIMPADTVGTARRIGLKLSFSAPWATLVPFLASLERASPPLILDDLQIHGSPLPFAQPAAALDTSVDVLGFRPTTGEASR